MSTQSSKKLLVIIIVVIGMAVAPMAASGYILSDSIEDGPAPQAITTYNASETVDVWEMAMFPFKAENPDQSFDVGQQMIGIKDDGRGETDLNKDGRIYEKGSTVNLHLTDSINDVATEDISEKNVTLIVARITPDADIESNNLPTTMSEARELLTFENANKNASFDVKNAGSISSGTLDISYELGASGNLGASGEYMFFLGTHPDQTSISVTDGDISISGSTTVVGMDGIVVREGASSVGVSSSTIEPGETVTFSPGLTSLNNVNQSVVLYKTDTVTNSKTTYEFDEISIDITSDNVTMSPSIGTVEGNATFDGPVTVVGTTLYDRNASGPFDAATITDFVVEEINHRTNLNQNGPEIVNPGSTTLYASADGLGEVAGDKSLEVKTLDTWADGEYKWIHIAEDSTSIYTDTGTITVNTPSGGGGAGDGTTDEEPAEEDEEEDTTTEEPPTTPEEPTTVEPTTTEQVETTEEPPTTTEEPTTVEPTTTEQVETTVEPPTTTEEPTTTDTETPGFTMGLALIALLGAALLALRRRE